MSKAVVTPENLEQAQTYIDFVKTNLEPLANQIGVSVEWLWNILVNQARVEAIVMLIVLLFFTVKIAIFATVAIKSLKKATFYNYKGTVTNRQGYTVYWFGIPAGILSVLLAIATPIMLPTIVTGLVNPQFRAIEKIVEFAKPNEAIKKVSEK